MGLSLLIDSVLIVVGVFAGSCLAEVLWPRRK